MKILIDNGHGANTSGKCSPDKKIREYAYVRVVAAHLKEMLDAEGFDAELLVPEETDISLRERVRRANNRCASVGASNCVLISLHLNAAGLGETWMSGRGWSAFVAQNASQRSKKLASLLAQEAEKEGLKVRRQSPGQDYWVQSLAMVRDTLCPAVLTENLFMDNPDDASLLLSADMPRRIARIHLEALRSYIASEQK